jgi:hypothetical protein
MIEKIAENREGGRHLPFYIVFAVIPLDASDELLNYRRCAMLKWEVKVSMHGFNVPKVLFDGLGLDLSAKAGNPRHDGSLRGWQEGAIGVIEVMVSSASGKTQGPNLK